LKWVIRPVRVHFDCYLDRRSANSRHTQRPTRFALDLKKKASDAWLRSGSRYSPLSQGEHTSRAPAAGAVGTLLAFYPSNLGLTELPSATQAGELRRPETSISAAAGKPVNHSVGAESARPVFLIYNEETAMKPSAILAATMFCLASVAYADDSVKDAAIKRDMAERDGTWQVIDLVVNGEKASAADMKSFKVTNHDNTWTITHDNREVARGTSTIDPLARPKTIDFLVADASMKDQVFHGIYEITGNTRKLCYAPPGAARPTTFISAPRSDRVLVVLQRVK
jgi:uncharacterized protein (TIGR03067 family)